jgi:23S rRNA (cytidine1920-2'-O)/16S rRNA (cytidine1409-2'-O)-methyltransferase
LRLTQIWPSGKALPYVSRGGFKLAHALDRFAINPTGRTCLDAGASTGGFTDVLLQRGASRVYAADVGKGLLAWTLRQDPRVVVMEGVNVRHLELPERVSLVVADLAFISLRLVLPALTGALTPEGDLVALVKPQFEAGQADVGKGGVVRSAAVHRRVLHEVIAATREHGLAPAGVTASPIRGQAGNIEFLLHATREARAGLEDAKAVEAALAEAKSAEPAE